jgi:hypothetical protein
MKLRNGRAVLTLDELVEAMQQVEADPTFEVEPSRHRQYQSAVEVIERHALDEPDAKRLHKLGMRSGHDGIYTDAEYRALGLIEYARTRLPEPKFTDAGRTFVEAEKRRLVEKARAITVQVEKIKQEQREINVKVTDADGTVEDRVLRIGGTGLDDSEDEA